MRYLQSLIIFCLIAFPFMSLSAPSEEFWNPFRNDATNITGEISDIIHGLLTTIGSFAGQVVSKIKIPEIQPRSAYKTTQYAGSGVQAGSYNLNQISLKSLWGVAPSTAPKIEDTSEEGKPCGGGTGDPFWANDCSCHCSKGAKPGTTYETTGYCPEDDNRTCEDCRSITRHDNSYTKVSECRNDF